MRADIESGTKRHLISEEDWQQLDLFDQIQIRQVIKICKESPSLSDAGRKLFGVSRLKKKTSNDSERLRKYLAKFGLSWADFTVD